MPPALKPNGAAAGRITSQRGRRRHGKARENHHVARVRREDLIQRQISVVHRARSRNSRRQRRESSRERAAVSKPPAMLRAAAATTTRRLSAGKRLCGGGFDFFDRLCCNGSSGSPDPLAAGVRVGRGRGPDDAGYAPIKSVDGPSDRQVPRTLHLNAEL